jgi:hypothetical protein
MFKNSFIFLITFILALPIFAQEQSRESAAVDPTAAQWSLQFAYEGKFDYKEPDVRGEGDKGFFQFRFVAPLPAQGWFRTHRMNLGLVNRTFLFWEF